MAKTIRSDRINKCSNHLWGTFIGVVMDIKASDIQIFIQSPYVRVTHIPTGTKIESWKERSVTKNKKIALDLLYQILKSNS